MLDKIVKNIIFLALLTGIAYPVWNIETVDTGTAPYTDVGWYSSLAIDSSGFAHISYLSRRSNSYLNLKYITNKTGSWVGTTIDTAGGYESSIAVDSSGYFHISYLVGTTLKYATNKTGSTVITTIDSSVLGGLATSIVLETTNQYPRICCTSSTSTAKYAYFNGSVWTVESAGGTAVLDTSLALNASNTPYIGYVTDNGEDILFLNKSASWVSVYSTIAGSTSFPSLKIGSDGNGRISYTNFTITSDPWSGGNLRYATRTGASWTDVVVDSTGDTGWWTSLALDASNYAYIAYHDHTSWDLKYATNKSGSWIINKVDSNGGVGYCTSIKLDSSGNPRISYYDVANNDLKYAKWIPGSYNISGYLRDSGSSPISNAVVFLTGGANGNYVSDANGYYEFTGLNTANFTITPNLAGTTFSPGFLEYTPVSSSQSNQNFTGAGGVGYFIRGYVTDPEGAPISNVLVSLSGTGFASDTTTAAGYYRFTGLPIGSYTTTFVKSGYIFVPASNTYSPFNSNQESQNIIGVPAGTASYIRGYVKDANGKAISGVIVSLSGTSTTAYTTAADGYYEFTGLSFGTYIVTSVKSGWTFNPSPKTYVNLYKNKDNQNISGLFGTVSVVSDVKIIGNIFNPANGEITTIWYNIVSDGRVAINVYSSDAILIRELINEDKSSGTYTATWAGTNREDQTVASGIYYVKVSAPGVNKVKKICIVK